MSVVDVAKEAGVSISTVSNVINEKGYVTAKTALRVHSAMKRIGFSPPPPERRRGPRPGSKTLAVQKQIALLVWQLTRAQMRSPLYADVLHGVESAARERQCSLVLHHAPPGAAFTADSLPSHVNGLIIFGDPLRSAFPAPLNSLPLVRVMGAIEPGERYDHISYKNALIGPLAANYLLSKGHINLAAIGPAETGGREVNVGRLTSFAQAVAAQGGSSHTFSADNLINVNGDYQTASRTNLSSLVDQFCMLAPQPTGLFVPADLLTASIYSLLAERGVRAGTDIEIVSCNNELSLISSLHPRPASIDLNATDVGLRAVEQLLWRIGHPDAAQTEIYLSPKLVPGE